MPRAKAASRSGAPETSVRRKPRRAQGLDVLGQPRAVGPELGLGPSGYGEVPAGGDQSGRGLPGLLGLAALLVRDREIDDAEAGSARSYALNAAIASCVLPARR